MIARLSWATGQDQMGQARFYAHQRSTTLAIGITRRPPGAVLRALEHTATGTYQDQLSANLLPHFSANSQRCL